MTRVVIGMDPHKRSVTIEVMAPDETVLDGGRYATDGPGYAAMLRQAKRWPDPVRPVEGCSGIGRHVATRLLADGEQVVDVPPKLSARVRVFSTGQGRKTDATDAHSVALTGTRMGGLRPVVNDQQLAVLRVLADRRRALGEDHTAARTAAGREWWPPPLNTRSRSCVAWRPPPVGLQCAGQSPARAKRAGSAHSRLVQARAVARVQHEDSEPGLQPARRN